MKESKRLVIDYSHALRGANFRDKVRGGFGSNLEAVKLKHLQESGRGEERERLVSDNSHTLQGANFCRKVRGFQCDLKALKLVQCVMMRHTQNCLATSLPGTDLQGVRARQERLPST